MRNIARTAHRQPTQLDRNQQDQNWSQREAGERQTQQAHHSQGLILPASAMQRCRNARGNRQQQRKQQGGRSQLDGVGITRQHQMRDRIVQPQRVSQVAVQNPTPVMEILLPKRRVQPVSMPQRDNVRRTRALAQHLLNRIARNKMNQEKNNRHYQPHHGNGIDQPEEQCPQRPRNPH